VDLDTGQSFDVGEFRFTPPPPTVTDFDHLHIGNRVRFWMYNGSTVLAPHHAVTLSAVGGRTFSLSQFDLGGWPRFEVPFSVTGISASGHVFSETFVPDRLSDGPGGVADFETFTLSAVWTGLVDATWTHTGPGTEQGIFGLDNIVVDAAPVPEPSTLVLLGAAIFGVSRRTSRRRRISRFASSNEAS
jgi:hypothetical protein